MGIRRESAIVVCAMYALLIVTCIGCVALGPATDPYTRESLLELPIFVQLLITEAIGLTPLLAWLARATHWTVSYLAIIASSFVALYWLGWWVGALNDDPT